MRLFATLAGLEVGDGFPVRLVGAINVSPESFYKDSVAATEETLCRRAAQMVAEGADFLDIGAMSTAPYLDTAITEEDEIARLTRAIRALRGAVSIPISVDTTRARAARAALEAGARIVNDVSGLRGDPEMAAVAKDAEGLILMAREACPDAADPLSTVTALLDQSLRTARRAHIPDAQIVLDPGIGFFRNSAVSWERWDCAVLQGLEALRELGRPILVGLSRKSFIGRILDRPDPRDRLAGSLAATAVSVLHGAHLVRTHDVGPTRDAVRMVEALRST
jgi:dihydropteroate synthase